MSHISWASVAFGDWSATNAEQRQKTKRAMQEKKTRLEEINQEKNYFKQLKAFRKARECGDYEEIPATKQMIWQENDTIAEVEEEETE